MASPIQKLTRTYRHIDRYRQIVGVLVRYGFGQMLEHLPLEQYTEIALKLFRRDRPDVESHSRSERLRLALEELGPAFVKLGQLLSTRPDLVPPDIVEELEKLQDQAAAFSGDKARAIIEEELERPVDEVFASLEAEPFAAASLGQVHRGVLADGREIVVKVMRPGVRRAVETDLEILQHLTSIAENHIEAFEVQKPSVILEEFRQAMAKELDYRVEAAHIKRFGRMFDGDEGVKIPAVMPELTTARVLTMERLSGRKISKLAGGQCSDFDRETVARRGADAILSQIFIHGFFHADPHPGNVLVLPGDVVGFVDFGQVGRITPRTRYLVADLLGALIDQDEEAATDHLADLTTSSRPLDRAAMETEMAEFIDWHIDRPVGELRIGRMVWQLLEIAGRQGRAVSPELFLVLKALGTLEGLSRALDPSFDLTSRARPLLQRLMLERFSPRAISASAWGTSVELAHLVRQLPRELREVLRQLRAGQLHVEFEHRGLEPALHTHELSTNRLVFAIVLAALVVGSSLLVVSDIPPKWNEVPVIGLVGYLLSGVIGLGLLWSILRRGRL
jgi:ubiquinone biosynthesis protein